MDAISAASRKIDAVTTASPDARHERRMDKSAGLTWLFKRLTTFDFGLGNSEEKDYSSLYGYFSVAHEMFDKNTTVGFTYSHNSDRVGALRIGEERGFPKGRETDSYTVSLSQVLSRTTIAAVGFNYINVRGYLGGTANVVKLSDGTHANEKHPGQKHRKATVFKINQAVPQMHSSMQLSYRFYNDNWSVDSHEIGGKFYQYLTDDWIMRLRYRYYDQSESFFWNDNPGPGQEYTTWDGRMKNMQAHLFGIKFIYNISELFIAGPLEDIFEDMELDMKWDRYYQNTGFNYNVFQGGLVLKF